MRPLQCVVCPSVLYTQAAMQFTQAQQQDLMLLRRLFYGKLGVLARERKQWLRRVPYGAAATAHDMNSRLADVVNVAQELHDITVAEFQTKLQFTSAYRRGVSCFTIVSVNVLLYCKLCRSAGMHCRCSCNFDVTHASLCGKHTSASFAHARVGS